MLQIRLRTGWHLAPSHTPIRSSCTQPQMACNHSITWSPQGACPCTMLLPVLCFTACSPRAPSHVDTHAHVPHSSTQGWWGGAPSAPASTSSVCACPSCACFMPSRSSSALAPRSLQGDSTALAVGHGMRGSTLLGDEQDRTLLVDVCAGVGKHCGTSTHLRRLASALSLPRADGPPRDTWVGKHIFGGLRLLFSFLQRCGVYVHWGSSWMYKQKYSAGFAGWCLVVGWLHELNAPMWCLLKTRKP